MERLGCMYVSGRVVIKLCLYFSCSPAASLVMSRRVASDREREKEKESEKNTQEISSPNIRSTRCHQHEW